MLLCDVNVLVHAHRADMPRHADCRRWLESVIDSDDAYGVSDIVHASTGCASAPPAPDSGSQPRNPGIDEAHAGAFEVSDVARDHRQPVDQRGRSD